MAAPALPMSAGVHAEKVGGESPWLPQQLVKLRCPHCVAAGQPDRGTLSLSSDRALLSGCGRMFPIHDGIPILMPDAADARVREARARERPEFDLSIIVPALHEGPNLETLLPGLRSVIDQ